MNTTNLFVELIVIGVGVFIWLLLLIGIVSPEAFNYLTGINIDILSAIPIVAIIYVLGILSDKSVDSIFNYIWELKIRNGKSGKKKQKKNFKKDKDKNDSRFFKTYNEKIKKYPELANKLEYIKSRIRIIRSWAVHFMLIAVTLVLYVYLRSPLKLNQKITLMIFAVLILTGFSVLSFYSWKYMTDTYYKKINDIK